MKAELKARWIAALNGGEYKQATGKLKTNEHIEYVPVPAEAVDEMATRGPGFTSVYDGVIVKRPLIVDAPLVAYKNVNAVGFCCLGVLCDITAPHGWSQDNGDSDYEAYEDSPWYHPAGNCDDLLWNPEGDFGLNEEVMNKLAELNDSGRPFSEIAKYIEENVT